MAVTIYLLSNAGRPSAHGWGVAMSTDTAFALGLLALVGPRFPDRLRAFMLTVVVVDDILALVVIALVYTDEVTVSALLVALGLYGVVLLAKALRVRVGLIYFALGAAIWVALLESGGGAHRRRARDGPSRLRLPGRAIVSNARRSAFASSASSPRRSSPARSALG